MACLTVFSKNIFFIACTVSSLQNIKIDKDTGLALLFSDKAPVSGELQRVKLDISKEDKCD